MSKTINHIDLRAEENLARKPIFIQMLFNYNGKDISTKCEYNEKTQVFTAQHWATMLLQCLFFCAIYYTIKLALFTYNTAKTIYKVLNTK